MTSLTLAIGVIAALVLAGSPAHAQTSAPGSTPGKPDKVATVPPPPPPGGPDKLTTQPQPPRPGVGDLTGGPHQKNVSKSYCYTYESAEKCVGWLTACMSPQSGSFSCAAGPGDNHQYVCVCVSH
jgi:hypothetical protein